MIQFDLLTKIFHVFISWKMHFYFTFLLMDFSVKMKIVSHEILVLNFAAAKWKLISLSDFLIEFFSTAKWWALNIKMTKSSKNIIVHNFKKLTPNAKLVISVQFLYINKKKIIMLRKHSENINNLIIISNHRKLVIIS